MKKLRKIFCRIFGHAFSWSAHIDRDGYVCPRCGCRVRSPSGMEAKIRKRQEAAELARSRGRQ